MHIKVPANTPQPITGDRKERRERERAGKEGKERADR